MPRASGMDASFRKFEPPSRTAAIRRLALLLVALLLAGLPATLAQEGLYGPEAPRDVSYVRIINARPGEAITPVVAGEELQPLGFAQVSSYRQLPPGRHSLTAAGVDLEVTTEAESFMTIALLPDEIVTIADTPLRDISRGLLALYNLTQDEILTLATADGTEVISEVPPHEAAARTISEAEVELVVLSGGEPVDELESRLYRRGEAHSVIVLPEGSDPRLIYAPAAAER